jgi:endopeptidase La
LELNRELWIKNNNKDCEYFKIEGYFINDTLSVLIKTSQLNYPLLYNKKCEIIKYISLYVNCDIKFVKKLIRYDYIGNIYCFTIDNYVIYVENMYKIYQYVTTSTFINIMKKFLSTEFKIKCVFNIIFLLLHGSDYCADMVILLLDITKEKKINTPNIYNIIMHNLPYYLQVRIKKSTDNIKNELERIKNINPDDVNYKTQLIINKNIPDNVKSLAIEKIEELKAVNNEYYKQLMYIKHIINFPWPQVNDVNIINNNQAVVYLDNIDKKLQSLTFGHTEAKKVLLQMIGKWITNPSSQGTCFGLVGPPGVGKTLLAKSVSKALDIPFAEITLGGQNDGELLHGHGYTYAGSQPGMIVKKMVEMGKSRCILYFDELDKACSKHGSVNEITSILIHLTDPNMNKTFQDRFFQGIDFPLDKVIMIFSYNDSKLVDPILLDRLKQINIEPYTVNDKLNIVKNFIISEVAQSIGLQNESWINIDDELIEFIIDEYTSEAGVRTIKRTIEKIFLTLNLDKIYKRNNFKTDKDFKITKELIVEILEKSNNESSLIHSEPVIGIINGLYATNNGDGGIIPIQIFTNTSSSNSFEMKYTGKQGDVMKESVQCSFTAAIEYIKRNKLIKDIDKHILTKFKNGFHIHTPSTATPKDGPSAGCAFTSAFISRILNKPIKNDIAMTGEIELTGKITKIGGLNFKLFGAKKAGVKMVYVSNDNIKDVDNIKTNYPKLIDNNFNVILVNNIDEIINNILV